MSRVPERRVVEHLDPEKVAYWYFRLNGFFQIENFVVHPERRGGQRTDADLLAIRFPFRAERLFDDPNDIMADDVQQLALSGDLIDIVIAEVKTNQPCTLNGPWTRQDRQNVHRVLAAIGCLPPDRIEAAAADIYRAGFYRSGSLRIRLVAVGRDRSEDMEAAYPEVTQLLWSEMLAFIWDRFHRYRQQKTQVDQWDRRVARSSGWSISPPGRKTSLGMLCTSSGCAIAERGCYLQSSSRKMTLQIDYQSQSFPGVYSVPRTGVLATSWDELLWAAITIGRPSTYHAFQYGPASFNEAIFRLSLVRMAVEQDWYGRLGRTDAFAALDPTEKGMVSYFLGMTLCKLFASRLLHTPWLLHLDVFRPWLNPILLGRSRPDLVGENDAGMWHAFESKGRSSQPTTGDKQKAKLQAQRLVSVNGVPCSLHIGSFAFFKSDLLEFYWKDPDPDTKEPIELPRPDEEWRYYYEPALSIASLSDERALIIERERADVSVTIHSKIRHLLDEGRWRQAREAAKELQDEFGALGFQPDGLRVIAGESWPRQFGERRRDL